MTKEVETVFKNSSSFETIKRILRQADFHGLKFAKSHVHKDEIYWKDCEAQESMVEAA